MPELTKTYQLKITVEQFLNACSDIELKEIDLLLGGYLNPPAIVPGEPMGSRIERDTFILEIQSLTNVLEYRNYNFAIKRIPTYLRKVFTDLLRMGFSLEKSFEALEVVMEMIDNTTVSPDEVLELMKYFSRIEKIRLQSLVKKPQIGNLKNEEL